MHRMDPKSTSMRGFAGNARGVVKVTDDDHNMQEIESGLIKSESRKRIERAQNYGFTSTPLPPDKDGKKGAEALFVFMGGNRSLPMIVAIDDRRHRPYGLKGGENAQYDDQGQMTLLARDGVYVLSNKKEASLRHVEKTPQQRKTGKEQQGQQQSSQQQDYDHKGTINTEVRCKKDRIEAVEKGDVVRWTIKDGKLYLGGDPDKDKFAKVVTEAGPAVNVYAKIG